MASRKLRAELRQHICISRHTNAQRHCAASCCCNQLLLLLHSILLL
jgi:hypothetical protein